MYPIPKVSIAIIVSLTVVLTSQRWQISGARVTLATQESEIDPTLLGEMHAACCLRRRYVRITYSLIILEADCLIVIQELARINDGVTWEVKDGPSATLSNKTNVWQVGMLLACCMRLRPYLPGSEYPIFKLLILTDKSPRNRLARCTSDALGDARERAIAVWQEERQDRIESQAAVSRELQVQLGANQHRKALSAL